MVFKKKTIKNPKTSDNALTEKNELISVHFFQFSDNRNEYASVSIVE